MYRKSRFLECLLEPCLTLRADGLVGSADNETNIAMSEREQMACHGGGRLEIVDTYRQARRIRPAAPEVAPAVERYRRRAAIGAARIVGELIGQPVRWCSEPQVSHFRAGGLLVRRLLGERAAGRQKRGGAANRDQAFQIHDDHRDRRVYPTPGSKCAPIGARFRPA